MKIPVGIGPSIDISIAGEDILRLSVTIDNPKGFTYILPRIIE